MAEYVADGVYAALNRTEIVPHVEEIGFHGMSSLQSVDGPVAAHERSEDEQCQYDREQRQDQRPHTVDGHISMDSTVSQSADAMRIAMVAMVKTTLRMTVRKIRESYRVSDEQKKKVKELV